MNTYCFKFENGKDKIDNIFNWIDQNSIQLMIEGEMIYKFDNEDLYVFYNTNGRLNASSDFSENHINLTGKGSFATDLAYQCEMNEFYFYELSDEKIKWKLTYFKNFNLPDEERICEIEKVDNIDDVKFIINWLINKEFDGSVGS